MLLGTDFLVHVWLFLYSSVSFLWCFLSAHRERVEHIQERETSRAKSLFMSSLSHELRGPLQPVVLALDTLLDRDHDPELFDRFARDFPKHLRHLKLIQHQVQSELCLVEGLLPKAKLHSVSAPRFPSFILVFPFQIYWILLVASMANWSYTLLQRMSTMCCEKVFKNLPCSKMIT